MRKLKFIIALCLVLSLLSAALVGCKQEKKNDKLNIVCTVFPLYDWVRNIVGNDDGIEVSLLVKNGADLHSYQATVADMVMLADCEILFFVGGESDAWLIEAITPEINRHIKPVSMLDILKEKSLALPTDANEHSHEHGEDCEHTLDEHIWLSPKIAEILCEEIEKTLSDILGDENKYAENLQKYKSELSALDSSFEEVALALGDKPLIFADRFPFKYLTEGYSIPYYAAFPSCSAESEASFEVIRDLSWAIDTFSIDAVFTVEGSSGNIARSVIMASSNQSCRILQLDSMQSVTQTQIDEGASYLKIMQKNLDVLRESLGE